MVFNTGGGGDSINTSLQFGHKILDYEGCFYKQLSVHDFMQDLHIYPWQPSFILHMTGFHKI